MARVKHHISIGQTITTVVDELRLGIGKIPYGSKGTVMHWLDKGAYFVQFPSCVALIACYPDEIMAVPRRQEKA